MRASELELKSVQTPRCVRKLYRWHAIYHNITFGDRNQRGGELLGFQAVTAERRREGMELAGFIELWSWPFGVVSVFLSDLFSSMGSSR